MLNISIFGRSVQKKTPLHIAASLGHAAACKIFIDSGADVHAGDAEGYTPLDDAEISRFTSVSIFVFARANVRVSACACGRDCVCVWT